MTIIVVIELKKWIMFLPHLHTHVCLSCRLSTPHTQTHPPVLLWHRRSSPAQWQWWMQNMKHINAADSGQCQAFLHCVKLNKQDQAKADGNWPSRDKALTIEAGGQGNLKPFSNLRRTHSKIHSTRCPNGHTFIQRYRLLISLTEFNY